MYNSINCFYVFPPFISIDLSLQFSLEFLFFLFTFFMYIKTKGTISFSLFSVYVCNICKCVYGCVGVCVHVCLCRISIVSLCI